MNLLTKIRAYRWAVMGRKEIRQCIREKNKRHQPVKIILGAGNYALTTGDWINTDLPQFDITDPRHWNYLFGDIKIDNLFAEHVFEHLSIEQNKAVLKLAQNYLKPDGNFRIAIPDKNNPDRLYQDGTRPGGSDTGADDHKIFLSFNEYARLVKETNFKIQPLEYFDEDHVFHAHDFNNAAGHVLRSKKNKYIYAPIPNYTSLIFDLKLSHS